MARERSMSFADRVLNTMTLLTGMAVGAGIMYLFDAHAGGRRRSLVRDKMIHGLHLGGRYAGKQSRNLLNHIWGSAAELASSVRDRASVVPDEILEQRVRSQLGHVVSHPGLIAVRAGDGEVTVSGIVLPGEEPKIRRRLEQTRGIRECHIDVR